MKMYVSCHSARRHSWRGYMFGLLTGALLGAGGALAAGGLLVMTGFVMYVHEVELPCLRGDR